MVGRTPEYLGRKVGAREMKLAMIALLVHPILILGPSGLFAATGWGTTAEANPGAHGFSEIVYQYSSASANNGSAMDGLGVTYGLNDNRIPSPEAVPWDIGTGLVMLFSRYLPIIAPIAMAFYLGRKKMAPVDARHDERRHLHLRLPVARHDPHRRRAALPARRRARTARRASRADPVRRMTTQSLRESRRSAAALAQATRGVPVMNTALSVPAPALNLARRRDLFSPQIVWPR